MKKKVGIVIGTYYQKKIADEIYKPIANLHSIEKLFIISLENYYKFGIEFCNKQKILLLHNYLKKPWHDCNKIIKLMHLTIALANFIFLSQKIKYFIFLEDSGAIEFFTIKMLMKTGCKVLVLQDGIKSDQQNIKRPNTFLNIAFGKSGADLYLLRGLIYKKYIRNKSKTEIVGSPIRRTHKNCNKSIIKILIVHQCFYRFNLCEKKYEIDFYSHIAKSCSEFGNVELRIHPQGDPTFFSFLKKDGVDVTWREKDIEQSINESSVIASVSSTVIHDAIWANKPVFILDWHKSKARIPSYAGCTVCKNSSNFIKELNNFKSDDFENLRSQKNNRKNQLLIAYSGFDSIRRICKSINSFVH
ncbi:hypothetical protein [Desulforegula conservatrix]|uniref:hypothetical protein n=1 Tax=Desulforegula conservatrix TaxID=153026 RepID=UPI0003FA82C6|nr:hypothetical protein [Desulforegula conservatrix]